MMPGWVAVYIKVCVSTYQAGIQGLTTTLAQWAGVTESTGQDPFPALLASLDSCLLMLSLNPMGGAATVDPINKYTI